MENSMHAPPGRLTGKMRPLNKKLLLFLAGACAIVVFFMLPPYKAWLRERIFAYYQDFAWQKNKMAINQRMAYRFEGSYTYSKQIAAFFESKGIKNTALVLIPPTDYFKQHGVDYHVPEPVVFYYYTGLRTLWPNSPYAPTANWYVRVANKKIVIDSITSAPIFADTLAAFNKFKIRL